MKAYALFFSVVATVIIGAAICLSQGCSTDFGTQYPVTENIDPVTEVTPNVR